jgi:hypothetical protein
VAWLRAIDLEAIRQEVERIRLTRAVRGLAKFIHGARGNRDKVVALVDDLIKQVGPGTMTPTIERDGVIALRERLKKLGVAP